LEERSRKRGVEGERKKERKVDAPWGELEGLNIWKVIVLGGVCSVFNILVAWKGGAVIKNQQE